MYQVMKSFGYFFNLYSGYWVLTPVAKPRFLNYNYFTFCKEAVLLNDQE